MFRSSYSEAISELIAKQVKALDRSNIEAEFPITPNLLKNTRFFKWADETINADHPHGSKENQWFDNTLPLF